FSELGPFDIVFCRNVLIYFDQDTKTQVLDRIADVMAPDGFLVLGASETTLGLSDKFRMIEGMRLHAPFCEPEDEPNSGPPAAEKKALSA
ncbi:MAG TPA: CheR family methyltransferase, partial [Hyphomicrobiales bacterium]|nr:CheR family methyltransferase [Hyphomicrobiales bacterium]